MEFKPVQYLILNICVLSFFVFCLSCGGRSSQTSDGAKSDNIYFSLKSKEIPISPSGTYISDSLVKIYDRKKGVFYWSILNSDDTLELQDSKALPGLEYYDNINHGKNLFKVSISSDKVKVDRQDSEAEEMYIQTFDSAIFNGVIFFSYSGTHPKFLNDSVLVVPVLFSPKGQPYSQRWISNATKYPRAVLLNVNSQEFSFIPELNENHSFNPQFFERPLLEVMDGKLYYSYQNTNSIYEIIPYSNNVRKIEVEPKSVMVEEFDMSKSSSEDYRLENYQRSSLATKLIAVNEKGGLIRCVKHPQEMKDEEGLFQPPYWADHVFEFVDIESGEVNKQLGLSGKAYNVNLSFYFNGKLYVENRELRSDSILVFDGFDF